MRAPWLPAIATVRSSLATRNPEGMTVMSKSLVTRILDRLLPRASYATVYWTDPNTRLVTKRQALVIEGVQD